MAVPWWQHHKYHPGAFVGYCRGWITVMRHWPAFRPPCLTVSSPSSTQQLSRSLASVARSILQMLSPVFTGFERPDASSSNWRSSYTELFTALHLSIGSAAVRCWSVVEASRSAELVYLQSSRRPSVATFHCRRSLICCCRPTTLEQSTCRRPVCPITHIISSETDNTFIPTIMPRHRFSCFAICGPWSYFYLGHFKYFRM